MLQGVFEKNRLFCRMSSSASYHIYSDPVFVSRYEDSIVDNAWNAHYERPSTLSLLPDNITGMHILDAGCGPGLVSGLLVNKGASVTAIDYSNEMIKRTLIRSKGRVTCYVADMNYGLPQLSNSDFDIIYASLVIHYIEDLTQLFREFARVLRPAGKLIFSTDHPALLQPGEMKFYQRRHTAFWSGFNVSMDLFQRSWEAITASLATSGFDIELVKDARPTASCAIKHPEEYRLLQSQPQFICVRAVKRPVIPAPFPITAAY
jgi:ubiquinone/menaquinone biosynthesis C-methylase UbiE